jgi:hypothetical protein
LQVAGVPPAVMTAWREIVNTEIQPADEEDEL